MLRTSRTAGAAEGDYRARIADGEPHLWNHVRRAVDDRQAKGRFILTGSSVPPDDVTRHSGAGRPDARVYRYRDNTGLEVDAIVDAGFGCWGAFEVKLGYRRQGGRYRSTLPSGSTTASGIRRMSAPRRTGRKAFGVGLGDDSGSSKSSARSRSTSS